MNGREQRPAATGANADLSGQFVSGLSELFQVRPLQQYRDSVGGGGALAAHALAQGMYLRGQGVKPGEKAVQYSSFDGDVAQEEFRLRHQRPGSFHRISDSQPSTAQEWGAGVDPSGSANYQTAAMGQVGG